MKPPRQVASGHQVARWTFAVTAPDGAFHTGTTRRRPTAALQRQVEAAYPSCVFPGCRMPASECDLDHRVPYAEGGPTDADHLAPACRYDSVPL